MTGLSVAALIDALDSVTWYNGLAEVVAKWAELPEEGPDDFKTIGPIFDYGAAEVSTSQIDYIMTRASLQILWMICVSLFGEYGTSPRYGWIVDIPGFKEFIRGITKTWADDVREKEYEGKHTVE